MAYGNTGIPSSTRAGMVLCTEIPLDKGTSQENMNCSCKKIKVNTCTFCEIGLSTQEEDADLKRIITRE